MDLSGPKIYANLLQGGDGEEGGGNKPPPSQQPTSLPATIENFAETLQAYGMIKAGGSWILKNRVLSRVAIVLASFGGLTLNLRP